MSPAEQLYQRAEKILRTTSQRTGKDWWGSPEKRRTDQFLATCLYYNPAALSLLLVASGLAKLDGGPPRYTGSHHHPKFGAYPVTKLRTMKIGAEETIMQLAQSQQVNLHSIKSNGNGNLVTPIGKWLRKFSIDEAPQLEQIARNRTPALTLVGPRPNNPLEWKRDLYPNLNKRPYGPYYHALLDGLANGITGLGSVLARNETLETRLELELLYARQASLWGDLRIIALTALPQTLFSGR